MNPIISPLSSHLPQISSGFDSEMGIQETSLVKQIEKILEAHSCFTIPLTELIIRVQGSFNLSEEVNQPLLELANKYVCNAAHHMLEDPLKCFLEILVNGFDASVANEFTIGQFGIGFLSILGMLDWEETHGVGVRVTTSYQDPSDLNHYMGYQIDLIKSAKDILVTFSSRTKKAKSGTIVEILPQAAKFSATTLRKIRDYAYGLSFYPYGRLEIYDENSVSMCTGNLESPILVRLILNDSCIKIIDSGKGIALEESLTKLLNPSSTSKVKEFFSLETKLQKIRHQIPLPKLVEFPGKSPAQSFFILTTKGVLVKKVQLPKTFVKNQIAMDVQLDLPEVALNIGRDEIIVGEYERLLLEMVILHTIKFCLNANNPDHQLLEMFFEGLRAFENRQFAPTSSNFSVFFKNTLKEELDKKLNIIAVDIHSAPELCLILKHYLPGLQLLPVPLHLIDYDLSRLYESLQRLKTIETQDEEKLNFINKCAQKKIFQDCQIVFIESQFLPKTVHGHAYCTNFELPMVLFVPVEFFNKLYTNNSLNSENLIHYLVLNTAENIELRPCQSLQKSRTTSLIGEFIFYETGINNKRVKLGNFINLTVKNWENLEMIANAQTIFPDLTPASYQRLFNYLILAWQDDQEIFEKMLSCRHKLFWKEEDLKIYLRKRQRQIQLKEGNLRKRKAFYKNLKGQFRYILKNDVLYKIDSQKLSTLLLENLVDQIDLDQVLIPASPAPLINFIFLILLHFKNLTTPHDLLIQTITRKEECYSGEGTTTQDSDSEFDSKSSEIEPGFEEFNPTLYYGNEVLWTASQTSIDYEKAILLIQVLSRNHLNQIKYPVTKEITFNYNPRLNLEPILLVHKEKENLNDIYEILSGQNYLLNLPSLRNHFDNIFFTIAKLAALEVLLQKNCSAGFNAFLLVRQAFQQLYISSTQDHDLMKLSYTAINKLRLYWPDRLSLANIFPKLIEHLSHDVARLTLLVQYSISTWEEQIQASIAPSFHDWTPLVALGKLYFKFTDEEVSVLVNVILKRARCWQETILLANFLIELKNQKSLALGKWEFLDLFIQLYVYKYHSTNSYPSIDSTNAQKCYSSWITALEGLCVKYQEEIQMIKTWNSFPSIPFSKGFTSNQLLQSFIQHNPSELNDQAVLKIFNKAPFQSGDSLQQRNKQCVINGTERNNIDTNWIEWFQNSLDAIRKKSLQTEKEIVFQVQIVQERQLLLAIEDHAGFKNLNSVLAFLLPDYSEKNDSSNEVGKMGNGLSTLQRYADKIFLKTKLQQSDYTISLIIHPLRNAHGEYVDSRIEWSISEDRFFRGTTIQLLAEPKKKEETWLDACYAINFLKDVIGSAPVDVEGIQLYQKTENNSKVLFNKKCQEFNTGDHYQLLKLEENDIPSFCFIQGVPYLPLKVFCQQYRLLPPNLLEYLSHGFVLNLTAKTLKPKQSRTKGEISSPVLEQLREALGQLVYVSLLQKCSQDKSEKLQTVIPFWKDMSHVKALPQFSFKAYPDFYRDYQASVLQQEAFDIGKFFTYFPFSKVFDTSWGSFKELVQSISLQILTFYEESCYPYKALSLQEGTKILKQYDQGQIDERKFSTLLSDQNKKAEFQINRLLTDKLKEIIQELKRPYENTDKNFLNTTRLLFLDKYLTKWFETKISCPRLPSYSIHAIIHKNSENSQNILEKLPSVHLFNKTFPKKLLRKIYETNYLIIRYLIDEFYVYVGEKSFSSPHLSISANPTKSAGGWFSGNTVTLNLREKPIAQMSNLILSLTQSNPYRILSSLKYLMEIHSQDGGLLFHELEHWRIKVDEGTFHSWVVNIYGKQTSFAASSKLNLYEFIREGRLDHVVQKAKLLIKDIFPSEDEIEQLQKIANYQFSAVQADGIIFSEFLEEIS